ncbi:hypothetical protein GMST_03780 [Geomonas silvestris]|uniref:Type IV pilus minor pilin FimU n=1 Tax=Geomonas silvestris TaxID=2740184 RepID=A0A6V8ME12_9BACT|nr:prepilin-type N-terminal cleavage/methylation domain-containing protein [Geomonas silvestris]GFO58053.1 hypothetical protein GMST_03780 [Geomonas silvestris]
MNPRGFTIVELVVTLFIAGILAAIAIPRFSQTNSKEKIKSQTRQLHADLVNIRLGALQQKKRSIVFFGPQQSTFKTYTSPYESTAAGTLVRVTNYPFVLKRKTGTTLTTLSSGTSDCVEFQTSGLTDSTTCTNSNMTLVVTPVTYGGGNNCVVVGAARINIGRMDNVSTCSIW